VDFFSGLDDEQHSQPGLLFVVRSERDPEAGLECRSQVEARVTPGNEGGVTHLL
jgi:hypothetical protein